MRSELAQGDLVIATVRPILRHLLANDDRTLFSDAIVAKVRGMMLDLARQVLRQFAEVEGAGGIEAFETEMQDLVAALLGNADLVGHAHALTIETQLIERLSERSGIDGVLSPLWQETVASRDEATATAAMQTLSAQARFVQQQQRMAIPLEELPQELFEFVLDSFSRTVETDDAAKQCAISALRDHYDPDARRIARLAMLVSAMGKDARRALAIDHAGVSLFVTALSMASGQSRETVILSMGENQCARLALTMRAAGLNQSAVEDQFLYLHPDLLLPDGFDALQSAQAAAMLDQSELSTLMAQVG